MNDSDFSKTKKIYSYNNVWIDWGVLASILGLHSSDSKKYNIDFSDKQLKKLLSILETMEKIERPRLLIGFQALECGSDSRRELLKKLCMDNDQVYLSLPEKSGFDAIHWFYCLIEIQTLYICFSQGFPNEKYVQLKMLQSVISEKKFNDSFKALQNIDFGKNKVLGEEFKNIVDTYKKIYDKKEETEIYKLERTAMYEFMKNITRTFLPRLLPSDLKVGSEKEISNAIEKFLESEYFQSICSVEAFLNPFVSLMGHRRGYQISSSERQDLLGIVEIAVFCDVGYVDKRIAEIWGKRPLKNLEIDLRRSGNLLQHLS